MGSRVSKRNIRGPPVAGSPREAARHGACSFTDVGSGLERAAAAGYAAFVSSAAPRLTWREFVRLPADDLRHELLGGKHVMTPPAGCDHGALVARIAAILDAFVRPRRLGWVMVEPAVRLSADTCVGPDVAFLDAGRGRLRRRTHLHGAPDLAVEVLSPSTRALDTGRKLRLYRDHGVREYWIVDPAGRAVDVRRFLPRPSRRVERVLVESVAIAGLSVDVADLFSVLD